MNGTLAPPSPSRVPLWALVLAYIATRVYLIGFFTAQLNSDRVVYFEYAMYGVDFGLAPYRHEYLRMEYPPLAYWVMCVPRLLDDERVPREAINRPELMPFIDRHHRSFRREMLLLDAASFATFLALVCRRRRELFAPASWSYLGGTTFLAHVLLDRLDLGVLFCVLAWAWCWLRGDEAQSGWWWRPLGYLALGLGVSFKLVPIMIAPLALVCDARLARGRRDGLVGLASVVLFLIAAVGPFAWYALGPTSGDLWAMFRLHLERGVEIESLPSTLMMMAAPLGMPITVELGAASWDLQCPVANAMRQGATGGMLAILAAVGLVACWPTNPPDRARTYRLACWTLLTVSLVAKVLSAQYLVWMLPLALLVGMEVLTRTQFCWLAAACVTVAALTTSVFPYLFFSAWGLAPGRVSPSTPHWIPCALLLARNGVLAAISVWLGWRLLADQRARHAERLSPVTADHRPNAPPCG